MSQQDCNKASIFIQSGIDLSSKALVELVAASDETLTFQRETALAELEQAIEQLEEAKDVLEGESQ